MKHPLAALSVLCITLFQIGCSGYYATGPGPVNSAPNYLPAVGWGGAGFYGGACYNNYNRYGSWNNSSGNVNTWRGGSASWNDGSGSAHGAHGGSASWNDGSGSASGWRGGSASWGGGSGSWHGARGGGGSFRR